MDLVVVLVGYSAVSVDHGTSSLAVSLADRGIDELRNYIAARERFPRARSGQSIVRQR